MTVAVLKTINDLQFEIQQNFCIMVVCVTCIVFLSAFYADVFIRGRWRKDLSNLQNIIYVPNSVISSDASRKNNFSIPENESSIRHYLKYLVYTGLYFLLMFYSVLAMKKYPFFMFGIQHVAIFLIITFYILQFSRPIIAIPVSVVFTIVWVTSMYTEYRWILNNAIVVMATLLTGYIQFKNFLYLQIFMWLAFVYDVYILAGFHLREPGSELFSFQDAEPTAVIEGKKACETLLCSLFNHNHNYELPTVFSIQLGSSNNYVYIGSGDIIIGAFAANFTFHFFKKIKHLFVIVFTFGLSVALLSQVTETPFPALLSIVPFCTVGLLMIALFSRRATELLLDTCSTNNVDELRRLKYQAV